jgi:hypothetical protein
MALAPLIPEVNRAGSTSSPLQIRSPAIDCGTPFPHASSAQGKKIRSHKNFDDPRNYKISQKFHNFKNYFARINEI